jgi:hypothetical protein
MDELIEEIYAAMRDLQDEYADGLINEHAYRVRKEELRAELEGAK